jgi:hypothetical protein
MQKLIVTNRIELWDDVKLISTREYSAANLDDMIGMNDISVVVIRMGCPDSAEVRSIAALYRVNVRDMRG